MHDLARNPCQPKNSGAWLFSPAVDLGVFLGSAVLSLALLGIGWSLGILNDDTPGWAWVPAILLVDVAHVYATAFRVYFDPRELWRRPGLYFGVPVLSFFAGWGVFTAFGPKAFWGGLAYLAVFHFVRQQYGWVALYRAKAGERDIWGLRLDSAAIYLATVYPLVYWHAHLPRRYHWFLPDGFVRLPELVSSLLAPVYWATLAAYFIRAVTVALQGRANLGKDVVVATTAICWYVGIVAFNSDYAFTVTNVVIHGVPYMALVYWYWKRDVLPTARPMNHLRWLVTFVGVVWVLAYAEELLWDRTVWGERSWLFGDPLPTEGWEHVFVPLLAVPQLTHYVLDGFIWKRKHNPDFARAVRY